MNDLTRLTRRSFGAMALASTAAACSPRVPNTEIEDPVVAEQTFIEGYGPLQDGEYFLPGIPAQYTQGVNRRMTGIYNGEAAPNTLDVDPYAKFLYHVREDGTATRYPVGVGRAGRALRGNTTMKFIREWPSWTPTRNMLRTEPEVYGPFAAGVEGGLRSPLGARALYLFRGSRDTHYRIHGTNDLESIGNSGSAGCIRMFNQDVIHLANAVEAPMQVLIRSPEESLRVDPENYERGIELPPKIITPEELFGTDDEVTDVLQEVAEA